MLVLLVCNVIPDGRYLERRYLRDAVENKLVSLGLLPNELGHFTTRRPGLNVEASLVTGFYDTELLALQFANDVCNSR